MKAFLLQDSFFFTLTFFCPVYYARGDQQTLYIDIKTYLNVISTINFYWQIKVLFYLGAGEAIL